MEKGRGGGGGWGGGGGGGGGEGGYKMCGLFQLCLISRLLHPATNSLALRQIVFNTKKNHPI